MALKPQNILVSLRLAVVRTDRISPQSVAAIRAKLKLS
jgi:hypothetical protein